MSTFIEEINEESKKYGGNQSNDFYEFKKGINRMRIAVKPKMIASHFFGKGQKPVICIGVEEGCKFHGESAPKDDKGQPKNPSKKMATYIFDRDDNNRLRFAELPLSVLIQVGKIKEDEDYAFEDYPLPYDIKVNYSPDEKDPKAKYITTPSIKREDLTVEEKKILDEAMSKMTPEQYVEKRIAKSNPSEQVNPMVAPLEDTIDYPEETNPDDIPF